MRYEAKGGFKSRFMCGRERNLEISGNESRRLDGETNPSNGGKYDRPYLLKVRVILESLEFR